MLHHCDANPDAAFITLTYDKENLPCSINKPDGVLLLVDLQNFWKRLRQNLKLLERDSKITYYACGEYGEDGNRPHYHAIVWGITANDDVLVNKSWGKGRTQTDLVEHDSIRYVAGYVSKKLGFNNSEARQGYPKPFQCSSGGLGLDWIKANWVECCYDAALEFRGRKVPLPRYYREYLDKHYSNFYEGVEARLCNEKMVSECELLLEVTPQLGGRSWAQLSALEKTTLYHALQRHGRLYNENLAKRQEIKLAGLSAKLANLNKRRLKI